VRKPLGVVGLGTSNTRSHTHLPLTWKPEASGSGIVGLHLAARLLLCYVLNVGSIVASMTSAASTVIDEPATARPSSGLEAAPAIL
jgi:hypothetical protein